MDMSDRNGFDLVTSEALANESRGRTSRFAPAGGSGKPNRYNHDNSSCVRRLHSSESSKCHCSLDAESEATTIQSHDEPNDLKKLSLVGEFKSSTGTLNKGVSGEVSDEMDCIAEEDDEYDAKLDVGVEELSTWTLPSLHLSPHSQELRGRVSTELARHVPPRGVSHPAASPPCPVPPIRADYGTDIHTAKREDLSSSASVTVMRNIDKSNYAVSPSRSVDFTTKMLHGNRSSRETKLKPPAVCALPKVPTSADFSIGHIKKKEECSRSNRLRKRRRRRRLSDITLRNVFVDTEMQNHMRRIISALRKHVHRRRKEQEKETKSTEACANSSQTLTVSNNSGRSPTPTTVRETASLKSMEHKTYTIAKLWRRAARTSFTKKIQCLLSPQITSGDAARRSDPGSVSSRGIYRGSQEICSRSGDESPSSCDMPDSYHVQRMDSGTAFKVSPALATDTANDLKALDNCWTPWTAEENSIAGAEEREEENQQHGPVTICTSNCRYEVVRRVSKRLGIKDVAEDEPWNLYWTDLSISPERCKEMKRFQKINHFPGMAEICRKDLLARNLNRMYRLFPKDYNFFPKTWCLPADLGDLCAYSRSRRNKTFILKPDTGCQGKGIYLTRNVRDLKPHTRMICQTYIAKPFLVDGYKFDMRVYTLVTSCDPLRVFVYKEGLVRFCTMPYHEPNAQNTNNVFMHLTNYAVNKHSRMYVVDDEAGSKRKISTLNKWLESKNYNVEEIWERIDELIVKTLIAALPVLRHNYHACFPSHDFTFACFELLGFDILLDHKLKPFILEVNHSPSFHTDAQIDKDVKESLLHDTFGILNLSQYDKKKVMDEDRKRVRERLLQRIHKDLTSMNSPSKDNINKGGAVKRSRRCLSSSESNLLAGKQDHDAINIGRTPSDSSLSMSESNPWKLQFDWEDNNLGNYRRVYPLASGEPDKYEIFFNQNLSSLFQETAASRAREEASRQQRDLYETLRREQHLVDVGVTPTNWRFNTLLHGHRYMESNARKTVPSVPSRPISTPAKSPPPQLSKTNVSVSGVSPKQGLGQPGRIVPKHESSQATKRTSKSGISRRSRQTMVTWKTRVSKARGHSFSSVLLEIDKTPPVQSIAQTSLTLISDNPVKAFPDQVCENPQIFLPKKYKDEMTLPQKHPADKIELAFGACQAQLPYRTPRLNSHHGFHVYTVSSVVQKEPEQNLHSYAGTAIGSLQSSRAPLVTPANSSPLWPFSCLNPYAKTFRPISPADHSAQSEQLTPYISYGPPSLVPAAFPPRTDLPTTDGKLPLRTEKHCSLFESISPFLRKFSLSMSKNVLRSETAHSDSYSSLFEQFPRLMERHPAKEASPLEKQPPTGEYLVASENRSSADTFTSSSSENDLSTDESASNAMPLSSNELHSSSNKTHRSSQEYSPKNVISDKNSPGVNKELFTSGQLSISADDVSCQNEIFLSDFGKQMTLIDKKDLREDSSLPLDGNCLFVSPEKSLPDAVDSHKSIHMKRVLSNTEIDQSTSTDTFDASLIILESVTSNSVPVKHKSKTSASESYVHNTKVCERPKKCNVMASEHRFLRALSRIRHVLLRLVNSFKRFS